MKEKMKHGGFMKYLLVLTTASLATAKMSFQSAFAKKGVRTGTDGVFFNMLIFFAAAMLFFPYLFAASGAVLLCGAIYAACNVAFQLTYTRALSEGNVSIAVMFANFGMLVPILVSCVFYGDRPSALRLFGIALTVLSFVVTVKPGSGKKERRYLLFALLAMLLNGLSLSVQKLAGKQGIGGLSFVAASYLCCALLSLFVYAICALRGRRKTFKVTKRPVLFAALAGCSLAIYLAVNTYAAGVIDGSFHYPAHSGGAILLSTLAGVLIFHDRLSRRQVLACAIGLTAIVLMNF
jgi:drug/metabolite transporter (DMT)-like permease